MGARVDDGEVECGNVGLHTRDVGTQMGGERVSVAVQADEEEPYSILLQAEADDAPSAAATAADGSGRAGGGTPQMRQRIL